MSNVAVRKTSREAGWMLDEVTSDTLRDSDFQSVFDLRSETSRQVSRFIFFR